MPLGLRPYVNQLVQVTSIMTQIIVDSQVLTELEKDDHEQFEQLPDGYEVDAVENTGANTQYRLWKGWNLLGIFYQDLDGFWLIDSYSFDSCMKLDTHIQAIEAIIERSGILI